MNTAASVMEAAVLFRVMLGQEEILISVWYGSIIQLDKLEFDGAEVMNNELQNKKMGVV